MNNYKDLLPPRFRHVSFEKDVPEVIKQKIAEQIPSGNGIFLWGDTGIGKTHVALAIYLNFLEKGIRAKFFNTGDFLEALRDGFGKDSDPNETGLFREIMEFQKGVLIFDDIGAEKATEWVRERLYLILNKKYEDMTPVIFTSNCDMEILSARLGDRIASRIAGMTLRVKMGGVDRRLSPSANVLTS